MRTIKTYFKGAPFYNAFIETDVSHDILASFARALLTKLELTHSNPPTCYLVRSYGVLLIFVEGRVLMAIPVLARGGMDSVVLVNWACLSITLIVTEYLLRWRQLPFMFSKT